MEKITTFYFTGIHCDLTFGLTPDSEGYLNTGAASSVLTTQEGDDATVNISITPNQNYIIAREYVSIINAINSVDLTDELFYPEENMIKIPHAQYYTSLIIKIAAISSRAYTSIYTGSQVDESVGYTRKIQDDIPESEDTNEYREASMAKVNAATLEGYHSDYFTPADRIASSDTVGLIKRGTGFVMEQDGTLNTDIKVQINHYTNTIDLFINTSEE